MEIQFGYLRFSLCHDDFATQIALDIPLRSVFLHLRHKNLAEIIRDIQNITNFVDRDYDDGRLPTVDSKPFDVQRLCPTAHSSVAHAPTASAWGGGATGRAGPGRGRSGERPQLCKSCKMFFLGKVAETAYICTDKQQEVQHFQNTSMETQKIYNLVILDASGSMEVIYNQALTGVNETLATIRRAQETHPELQQYVTLASFSAGDDFLNRIYSAKPIAEARNITSADYPLLGCTALYDAMGTCISELQQRVCHGDRVLVTIITDGYENASLTWNGRQIKSLVQELRQMGWTFTYIGADQDVEKVAGEIGVCNALRFSANVEDTAAMFEKEGRSRTRFYDKVCCEMRAPDASLAESDDYFADDDTPEALEDILKSEAKGNR